MNWKKNALLALAISAIGGNTVACGGDNPPAGGETYTYIINTADVPSPDAMDRLPGFDLDGMTGTAASDRCDDALDYTSPVTMAGGVDNQLGANVISLVEGMLDTGVAGAIEEQIAAGSFLLLMEVSNVNSFNNDSSVDVTIFLGGLPAGTTAPMLGGDGRLVAGQTFTSMTTLATITGASISGGRLSVQADTLPISLAVSGMNVTLTLREARIAGTITETGMSGGEIGAQLQVADIVTLATMFGLGVDEATIRGVAAPDLAPNADGSTCEAISAGLTFGATTAANLAP